MSLTLNQKIFFGVIILLIFIIILGLFGIIPGIKSNNNPVKNLNFSLNVWVLDENVKDLNSYYKQEFKKRFPKSKIFFRKFNDYKSYEYHLLNALAEGKGPDIFMIKNTDIEKYVNKLYPISNQIYSLINLRENFPYIVEQDVFYQGKVYGLPISVDIFSLIYNRNLFDQNNILQPPKTWEEFLDILLLIEKNEKGLRKGAAIGSVSLEKVPTAKDLFFLLMLQKKVFKNDKLERNDFIKLVDFYLNFSNFLSQYYTWNDEVYYKKAFLNNEIAIIFDYYSSFNELKKNKKEDIAIDIIPQFDLNNKMNLASYYVFVVSKQSRFKDLAWKFILDLTLNDSFLINYLEKNEKLPILKKIINKKNKNFDIEKIKYQILTARSLNFINNLLNKDQEIFDKLSLLKNEKISFNEFLDYIDYLMLK